MFSLNYLHAQFFCSHQWWFNSKPKKRQTCFLMTKEYMLISRKEKYKKSRKKTRETNFSTGQIFSELIRSLVYLKLYFVVCADLNIIQYYRNMSRNNGVRWVVEKWFEEKGKNAPRELLIKDVVTSLHLLHSPLSKPKNRIWKIQKLRIMRG